MATFLVLFECCRHIGDGKIDPATLIFRDSNPQVVSSYPERIHIHRLNETTFSGGIHCYVPEAVHVRKWAGKYIAMQKNQ